MTQRGRPQNRYLKKNRIIYAAYWQNVLILHYKSMHFYYVTGNNFYQSGRNPQKEF